MSEYPRLVHWSYFDGRGLFSGKNGKESLTKVFILNEKGEQLLKEGKVACLTISGLYRHVSDPYFKMSQQEGYTTRARAHGELRRKMRDDYPELENKLTGIKANLLEYGEYVYINMPHLDGYVNPIVKDNEAFLNKNLVHKERFTAEFLLTLINYRPRALFGNEVITSYENEAVPKLLIELKSKFPQLFAEVVSKSDTAKEIYEQLTYKGKRAKLATLKPGDIELRLGFTDRQTFRWDGKALTNKNKMYDGGYVKQSLIPDDSVIVTIIDDSVVSDETEWVD